MKKSIIILLTFSIIFSHKINGMDTQKATRIKAVHREEIETKDTFGKQSSYDKASAIFLFVAGSWLARKQLPRLAGQQIEYNAPNFTKIVASVLFSIGITGGLVGAYKLSCIIREKLNALDQSWSQPCV